MREVSSQTVPTAEAKKTTGIQPENVEIAYLFSSSLTLPPVSKSSAARQQKRKPSLSS